MKILKDKIEHIAHLAKIDFSPEEKEKFTEEFSQILDFVSKLEQADTSSVSDLYFNEAESIARDDRVEKRNQTSIDNLVEAAPDKDGRLIKTKKIF